MEMYKIVGIGDTFTGKTSIFQRYTHHSFSEQGNSTIGVEFSSVEQPNFKMTLWDTAGQERYRTLTSSYYRGAHAVLLVYSVNDRNSFTGTEHWLKEFNIYGDNNTLVILVANKIDLEPRHISSSEGAAWANQKGLAYAEVSAKTGTGVNELFQWLIDELKKKPIVQTKNTVQLNKEKDTRRETCCSY